MVDDDSALLHLAVESMLDELETTSLEVVLIPLRGSRRCRRVVVAQNPDWYQALCARYPKRRGRLGGAVRNRSKSDTLIKRDHVYRGLIYLALGKETVYTERLWPFVESRKRELEIYYE